MSSHAWLLDHEGGPGSAGQNVIIILSNFAYAFPAVQCVLMKKYVQAFVFFGVMITSSLYHACKFGAHDVANPEGWCLLLSFPAYFFLDHLFALTTIPCLFMALTSLDVVIFDVRHLSPYSSSHLQDNDNNDNNKQQPLVKIKFLFGWLWRWMSKCRSREDSAAIASLKGTDGAGEDVVSVYANKGAFKDRFALENGFAPTSDNGTVNYRVLKRNMAGLEHAYILTYAYLIGVGLFLRFHSDAWFYVSLVLSCLGVVIILGIYFYVRHDVVSCFKPALFWPAIVLATCSLILMGIQNFLPPQTYWVTHSMWHVTSGLGIWLIYLSKELYCCYRRNNFASALPSSMDAADYK